jgi:hypothetical protein
VNNAVQAIKDACKSKDDKCKEIEANIAGVAGDLRARYLTALADPKDLYNTARTVRYARRVGTWYGHQQQFENQKANLRKLISEADANGCQVSPNDRLLLNASYPVWPLPRE